jgi:hypothetical protein
MNNRILRNNLFALLGYTVLIQLVAATQGNDASIVVLMWMMIAVGLHVGIALLMALYHALSSTGKDGGSWLLSALIVAIVGFGLCYGGAQVAEVVHRVPSP